MVALSADRFLAIYLHLRYQERMTHKRVAAMVISVWVFCAILSLDEVWRPRKMFDVIEAVISTACLLATAVLNYKIYLAVRQHAHQIGALQALQVAQNGERVNFGRLKKYAVTTIYLCFIVLIRQVFAFFWIGTITSFEPSTVKSGRKIQLNNALTRMCFNNNLSHPLTCRGWL